MAAAVLSWGVPSLGCGFWCSVAATAFSVFFDALHAALTTATGLWGWDVPGSSQWSGAGTMVMLAGCPCFPHSLVHPTEGSRAMGCSACQAPFAELLLWGQHLGSTVRLCVLAAMGARVGARWDPDPLTTTCLAVGLLGRGQGSDAVSSWQVTVAPCNRRQGVADCAAGSLTWPSMYPKHGGREKHKQQVTRQLCTARSPKTTA